MKFDALTEIEVTLKGEHLPTPTKEYRFAPPRRFRFDYAWPDRMVALEYEGGLYATKGGHTSISGYAKDCEKYNLAALAGWTVIRVCWPQIDSGVWLGWIRQALG